MTGLTNEMTLKAAKRAWAKWSDPSVNLPQNEWRDLAVDMVEKYFRELLIMASDGRSEYPADENKS